jgi:hypothetical protein
LKELCECHDSVSKAEKETAQKRYENAYQIDLFMNGSWWTKENVIDWRHAHMSLCRSFSLWPHHSITQSLNNESLVSGKTFNLILVKNRSRGLLLKHWDLWTVQMALNFSFLQLFFYFCPKKKKEEFIFFWKKERQKECSNEIHCRAYISWFCLFHNSHRFSSHLGFVTQMKECSIFSRFLILRIFFFRWFFVSISLSEVCYLRRRRLLCVNW